MNTRAITIGATLALTAGMSLVLAQAPAPTTVDGLVSAAKTAAGIDWAGTLGGGPILYRRSGLCDGREAAGGWQQMTPRIRP